MATPEETRLDEMLRDFERRFDNDSRHPGRNLRDLIDRTPELRDVVLESIRRGNLERFEDRRPGGGVGSYNAEARMMRVSVDQLERADRNPQAANTVLFTMGHELQHGVNRQDILDQDANLRRQAAAIAAGPSPHDYTGLLRNYNETSRNLEVNAEIAGFNMVVDSVRRRNPNAALRDIYDASPDDMRAYINADLSTNPPTYTPRPGLPGLTAENGFRMGSADAAGVNRHFYEAVGYPPGEIGRAMRMIRREEDLAQAANPGRPAPDIRVDLDALGIGGTPLPPGFRDSSRHRQQGESEARDPRSASHPDHGYYQMLRDRLPSEVPDNAVAHAMYLAKENGMTEPSRVDAGQITYTNGSIWVGGTTPGYRVSADPVQSPPMAQVSEQLESQRGQQLESTRVTQQTQNETRAHAPHAL